MINNNPNPVINDLLILYVVRNEIGQFFRAKGYGSGGSTWVDDINKAKNYGRIGGARGTITFFANNYPKYPTPELIKLTVSGFEVIDETERVRKAKAKKEKKEAEAKSRKAKRDLEDAERKFNDAKRTLDKIKNKS